MRTVDVTWLSYLMFAAAAYYLTLFALPALRRFLVRRRDATAGANPANPWVFFVVPARNEEAVIARTIESLLAISYERMMILVMNDGSEDATSRIASGYVATGRVRVVNRDGSIAGKGKGAVLNHAFSIAVHSLREGEIACGSADEVVVAIVDADGRLDPACLEHVLPYFDDPSVGGLQIGVRITNADQGVLPRLQDFEFVGFSALIQESRDLVGSVGLGGNGQFTRLSALASLGEKPWTDCLTEDLDLGLRLVKTGWRLRFCGSTYVAQQGLTDLRALMRQRTRWIQGHYQCWGHLPSIAVSKRMSVGTKVDLLVYIMMVVMVLFASFGLALSIGAMFGLVVPTTTFLSWIPEGPGKYSLEALLSFGPVLVFMLSYQRKSLQPLRIWELPAMLVIASAYAYLFVVSHLWAWTRLGLRRSSWAKTARLEVDPENT